MQDWLFCEFMAKQKAFACVVTLGLVVPALQPCNPHTSIDLLWDQNMASSLATVKGSFLVMRSHSLCIHWAMQVKYTGLLMKLFVYLTAWPDVLLVPCGSPSCRPFHPWTSLIHRLATHKSIWFPCGHGSGIWSCKPSRSSLHRGRCVKCQFSFNTN